MRKFYLMSALCLVTVLGLCGCKSSPPPEDLQPVPEARDEPPAASMGGYNGDLNGNGGGGFGPGGNGGQNGAGSWQGGATEDSAARSGGSGADGWTEADPSGNRLNMPIVYFKYDSDELVAAEAQKLDAIAEFMNNNQGLGLVIEGHCDQRGTDEYNRALGERRANAIRAYLAGRGLADNRMRTVSYGKDKPAAQGNGEDAWRQNRRGVPVPMRMGR